MAQNSNNFKRPALGEWNPFKQHIAEEVKAGDFVGSHTVLIAAGPARLSDLSVNNGNTASDSLTDIQKANPVYPLGIVQSASVTQNKQLQRLFEIGSYRSYFIPGRVIGQINLGVVLFDGPSVLRATYAAYNSEGELSGNSKLISTAKSPADVGALGGRWSESAGSNEEFYINLGSDLFNKPVGLLFYLTDNELNPYGAFYCEDCYTQGHNVSLNSGSVVIVEGISIQFDRLIPVKIQIDSNNDASLRG